MRNIFIKNLIEAARQDPSIYLLTADLGFQALEKFESEFPERFINVGVAESNMIGIATGLALTGKKVYVYSIVPFVTLRCLEQVRNNICHNNLNVKLVGVGGGFNYGNQGISHNTIEDLAVMRVLPNMMVLCPADPVEADIIGRKIFEYAGPAYICLGKAGKKQVYDTIPEFSFGRGILVNDGKDLTIMCIGNIIDSVIAVRNNLECKGISVRIISMPCLKPFDNDIIKKAAKETKAIFTIEERSKIGGLGEAVAGVLMEAGFPGILFKMFAVSDDCHTDVGSHEYLKEKKGLGSDFITEEIIKLTKWIKWLTIALLVLALIQIIILLSY